MEIPLKVPLIYQVLTKQCLKIVIVVANDFFPDGSGLAEVCWKKFKFGLE